MGKKKNKNKVSGAVKTAAKTEKKLANKLKKELATLGEVSLYGSRLLFLRSIIIKINNIFNLNIRNVIYYFFKNAFYKSWNLLQEDIAKVIAEIEREEAKRAAASEKTLKKPPTSRAYASLTPHPTNNELIMFGGEFHNGQKVKSL